MRVAPQSAQARRDADDQPRHVGTLPTRVFYWAGSGPDETMVGRRAVNAPYQVVAGAYIWFICSFQTP